LCHICSNLDTPQIAPVVSVGAVKHSAPARAPPIRPHPARRHARHALGISGPAAAVALLAEHAVAAGGVAAPHTRVAAAVEAVGARKVAQRVGPVRHVFHRRTPGAVRISPHGARHVVLTAVANNALGACHAADGAILPEALVAPEPLAVVGVAPETVGHVQTPPTLRGHAA